jgi:hypothetical protein
VWTQSFGRGEVPNWPTEVRWQDSVEVKLQSGSLACSCKALPFAAMAKSKFEYVKKFEQDVTLLPNTWLVVRIDGALVTRWILM